MAGDRPRRPLKLWGYIGLGAAMIIGSGIGLVTGAALDLLRRRRPRS
jgi:hypothetical protein